MIDLNWLSQEANTIHTFFTSIFYLFVTVLLLIGVLTEFFQMPLGGVPSFSTLVGRALVAAILLHTYPEVSRMVAEFADAMSKHLGDLNQFKLVLDRMGDKLQEFSFSWVSVKGSLVLAVSFLTFFLLYFSVHVTQAFLIYTWTVLYVFSPILIALFVLPQTAGATKALYRSLFEASAWKVVWAVLATLLWSTGVSGVHDQNVIAAVCFNLILAGSLVLTPVIVHMLAKGGLASMTSTVGSIAIGGLTTLTPAKAAAMAASLGKNSYNQALNTAERAAANFPKAHQALQSVPRFQTPDRKPLFRKKDTETRRYTANAKKREDA